MKKLKKNQFKDFLFIIQARLNSKRLPNKILLPYKGRTILEYLYLKIKKEFSSSKIIIAIPSTKENLYLKKFLEKKKLKYSIGSEFDLVSRYKKACININSKYIVRLTSDNPLINLKLIKYSLKSHIISNKIFSSTRNITKKKIYRFFPKGHSLDIINKKNLLQINLKKLTSFEREHFIPFFYKNFECNFIRNKNLKSMLNLEPQSIDTFKDYLKLINIYD